METKKIFNPQVEIFNPDNFRKRIENLWVYDEIENPLKIQGLNLDFSNFLQFRVIVPKIL